MRRSTLGCIKGKSWSGLVVICDTTFFNKDINGLKTLWRPSLQIKVRQKQAWELTWDCVASLRPRSVMKRLLRFLKHFSLGNDDDDTMPKMLSKYPYSEGMTASRFGYGDRSLLRSLMAYLHWAICRFGACFISPVQCWTRSCLRLWSSSLAVGSSMPPTSSLEAAVGISCCDE